MWSIDTVLLSAVWLVALLGHACFAAMLWGLVVIALRLIDGLWPLWNARRQAPHDKVVRSIVVRAIPCSGAEKERMAHDVGPGGDVVRLADCREAPGTATVGTEGGELVAMLSVHVSDRASR